MSAKCWCYCWGTLAFLVFVSQVLGGYSFDLDFQEDEPLESSGDTCGGEIISTYGTISSPNFPAEYNPYQECIWVIGVPEHNRINLWFLEFLLEDSANCKYDSLEVRDGPTSRSPSLRKLCGGHLPPMPIQSSGNTMTLVFMTDSTEQERGFSAQFSMEPIPTTVPVITTVETSRSCGGRIESESGNISSPNFPRNYRPDQFCSWTITVPRHNRVNLRFHHFRLETSRICNYDYVKVLDGGSLLSPTLGTFCGFNLPRTLQSSRNIMTVVFNADATDQYTGFFAEFTKVPIATILIISTTKEPEETWFFRTRAEVSAEETWTATESTEETWTATESTEETWTATESTEETWTTTESEETTLVRTTRTIPPRKGTDRSFTAHSISSASQNVSYWLIFGILTALSLALM